MKDKFYFKYKKSSMKNKIVISCAIAILFALLIHSFIFSKASSKIIYNQVKEINMASLNSIQDEFYTINKSIENSIITIYNQKEFIRDLISDDTAALTSTKYRQLAYDMEHESFDLSQNVVALYIYDNEDNLVSYFRHAQTPKYSYPANVYDDTTEEEEGRIKEYVNSDDRVMLITSTYNRNREVNLVRYVLKIYDNTDVIGYIVCDTDPMVFSKLLDKYKYLKSQLIWIQPIGDEIVVKSGFDNNEYIDEYNHITEVIENGLEDEKLIYTKNEISNRRIEIFKADELKYNFVVWSLIPRKELVINQNILIRNMAIVLFVLFIFICFLFVVISENLTKPLTYIITVMEKIKLGDTKLRLKINNNDEIGALSTEFNKMLDEIEVLNKKDYQSKILLNESKYKALQAQINPHFLYNTLETMSGVATAQNCDTVSTLCIALANMFRYNLDMVDVNTTLEQEILHLKNYVYVMNVRMNGAIIIEYDIQSNIRDIKIPKLTLQPLVENSILHGYKNKLDKVKIKISVHKQKDFFEISVEDNGEGIDEDRINKKLSNSLNTSLNKKESIGLDNINARLQLLFGEEYKLRVNNNDTGGTKVTLTVPL